MGEDEFQKLQVSKLHKGENPAVSVAKLILGIFFAVLSLSWILHIVLCVLAPQLDKGISVRFLDALFEAFESTGVPFRCCTLRDIHAVLASLCSERVPEVWYADLFCL